MSDFIVLIQEKIATGHFIEAGTLLKLHADTINAEKYDELQQAITELQAAAEELMNQAEAEEKEENIPIQQPFVVSWPQVSLPHPRLPACQIKYLPTVSHHKKAQPKRIPYSREIHSAPLPIVFSATKEKGKNSM